ncbi:centrosomal protein of 76 kDa-like isoform X3 [Penaeus chinensis]|uniref:centrosomal protein of 76 kDa-like isoform X3 n=1 Tax=Penaeus chinensis TaxID=139456 RepID=UPI001FB737FF|nr:centrosomal protein of 76 kDa-like isoform X3 [Penaeus chinensis]
MEKPEEPHPATGNNPTNMESPSCQVDLKSSIDNLIQEVAMQEAIGSVDPNALVTQLLNSASVQSMLQRVSVGSRDRKNREGSHSNLPPQVQEKLEPGHRYLYVHVAGGRAFVDHLEEERNKTSSQSTLLIILQFMSQRFEIKGIPCSCDPEINKGHLFDLQELRKGCGSILGCNELLTTDSPLLILLLRCEGRNSMRNLISVYKLEWRPLLAQTSGQEKFVCQLMGIGSEQIPVGLLDIQASVIPSLDSYLPGSAVSRYLEEANTCFGERRRLFINYARQWWREYTEAGTNYASRSVRIFAMDENGKNRFVCEYVRQLEAGHALRSPEEAARWVSIIPTKPVHQMPADGSSHWYTLPVAVMAQSLNVESKCSLLCSLLLGFGLDAWVCVGTLHSGGQHTWVMTRGPYTAITFWESSTGCRYVYKLGQKAGHDYGTVGSIFNHQRFYASVQVTDKIGYCNFMLEDENAWKRMLPNATSSMIQKEPCKDFGLSTNFDDHLSHILTPALWSYERKAVYSVGDDDQEAKGAEHFSAALMHTIPEGHTFKAFPLHFMHQSPQRAFNSIMSSSIGREIVGCRGDKVCYAVRAITVNYPENMFLTWLMVACSYRPVG